MPTLPIEQALFVLLQACAAWNNARASQDLHRQAVVRSVLTDTSLLQTDIV